jgi:hypothetical protein
MATGCSWVLNASCFTPALHFLCFFHHLFVPAFILLKVFSLQTTGGGHTRFLPDHPTGMNPLHSNPLRRIIMEKKKNPSASSHPMLSPLPPDRAKKGKVVSAEEAVRIIRDGDTDRHRRLCGHRVSRTVAIALESYFLETCPRDLTLVYAAGQGDGKERGLNHLGHLGLVKRVVGGHWGLVPKLQRLALDNKIEGYNLPQGVISHMYRDIAAHKPRTITTVGSAPSLTR